MWGTKICIALHCFSKCSRKTEKRMILMKKKKEKKKRGFFAMA